MMSQALSPDTKHSNMTAVSRAEIAWVLLVELNDSFFGLRSQDLVDLVMPARTRQRERIHQFSTLRKLKKRTEICHP